MKLGRKSGLFITGTDTGVGKTLIAGAIAKVLLNRGVKVGVFKPISTGCHGEKGKLISDDAKFLCACASCQLPLNVINPVCYATPAAPIVSAEIEHRPVDYSRIEDAYLQICEQCDFVIVEGIGGIRVPISPNVDVLEIADQFGLPLVVVARPNLGTINHTLLTVDAIRINQLPLAGVVISGTKNDPANIAEKTAPDIIREVGDIDILAAVPYDGKSSVEQCRVGEAILNSLAACDWQRIGESGS